MQAAKAHIKQGENLEGERDNLQILEFQLHLHDHPKGRHCSLTAVGPSDAVSAIGRTLPEAHTCPCIGQLSHSVLHSSTLHSKVRSITSGNLNACAHKSHSLSSLATPFQNYIYSNYKWLKTNTQENVWTWQGCHEEQFMLLYSEELCDLHRSVGVVTVVKCGRIQ